MTELRGNLDIFHGPLGTIFFVVGWPPVDRPRRAGTIFQQGVKVKNHLFDMSEVSMFDPNLKF